VNHAVGLIFLCQSQDVLDARFVGRKAGAICLQLAVRQSRELLCRRDFITDPEPVAVDKSNHGGPGPLNGASGTRLQDVTSEQVDGEDCSANLLEI
jgi:hypothetical protein